MTDVLPLALKIVATFQEKKTTTTIFSWKVILYDSKKIEWWTIGLGLVDHVNLCLINPWASKQTT